MTTDSSFEALLARLNDEQREDEAEERACVRNLLGDEPHDLAEDTADSPTDGNRVPREGDNPTALAVDDERQTVRELFDSPLI